MGLPSHHKSAGLSKHAWASSEDLRAFEADPAVASESRVDFMADDRLLCETSLVEFAKYMWPVIEPAHPFVDGWVFHAICEHLEAVSKGQIQNLLINVFPGASKSSLVNVLWPAWEWGPLNRPNLRIVSVSHADAIAIRDNLKCRRLIQSPRYQRFWGDRFKLSGDQNAKTKFENDHTGFKMATHVGGVTGDRGDRLVIDDPHQVREAESDANRESARLWFTEVAPTRINEAEKSSIVVIMQRLHEADISGLILEQKFPFEHLVIPMRYEVDRKYKASSIGWTDPRTQEGELAWPERFSEGYVTGALEPFLSALGGEYAIAGQLQQRPVPRGGGDFKIDKLVFVDAPPDQACARVRGWDLAASMKKQSPWTVGLKMAMTHGPKPLVYVEDVVRIQGDANQVEFLIRKCAERDGHAVIQDLPQDPGQSGKAQISAFAALLSGYVMHSSPESGDKVARAQPFAAQVNAGNVRLVRAPWNDAFVAEAGLFPNSKWKDQIDACSRAYAKLLQMSRTSTTLAAPILIRG